MKNKGQALVEFVIILPIFLFMLLGAIDLGRVMNEKNSLEAIATDISLIYKNGMSDEQINSAISSHKDITVSVQRNDKYLNLIISKKINIITPILKNIIDNPFIIETKRVINSE